MKQIKIYEDYKKAPLSLKFYREAPRLDVNKEDVKLKLENERYTRQELNEAIKSCVGNMQNKVTEFELRQQRMMYNFIRNKRKFLRRRIKKLMSR